MNEIDYRPMLATGLAFKEAVKFWSPRNQCVKELEKARKALYRSGVSSSLGKMVTSELRKQLHELESMKSDGRWQEVA